MDSVTQAALGAAVGGAVLGRRLGRKALLVGALLGTLPDLDVVIDYGDAVANITEHRGVTHSLFVLTGLGTLLALLTSRLIPRLTSWQSPARSIPPGHWWLFYVLCLITHPLLDAMTTYGTQLWWPLDRRPSAWPVLFIIDPLFTLPLLIGIAAALITGSGQRGPAWGLALSCAYLAFAFSAKAVVEQRLEPILAARGLEQAPRLVQPTPLNTLLWRATVVDGDDHHEALIGLFDGASAPHLETYARGAELEPHALTSERGRRLDWFAGPFLRYESRVIHGQETLVATDLRLGFPGFHPFDFALATRDGDAWQPVEVSEPLVAPPRGDREALSRLGRRLLSPEPPLCTSDFVAEYWVRAVPEHC